MLSHIFPRAITEYFFGPSRGAPLRQTASGTPGAIVEISNLSKRFGPIAAVDGVSFAVRRGEVLGFLGPNGAGKTTTMRMITGYLPPDGGRALVAGFDVATDPLEVKARVGYLPEGAPLYGDMTPAAFLAFCADIRGLVGPTRARRLEAVTEALGLKAVWLQPIETLSKGFKRRVGLAQALLINPEVLILDEPTDGLDPNQKHEVRTLLQEMAGDKAIIISTHILEEVEAVCTRAVVIAKGRVVADDTPAALLARSERHHAVAVTVASAQAGAAQAAIKALAEVKRSEVEAAVDGLARVVAFAHPGRDALSSVRQALSRAGVAIHEIGVERGRLDEVFRSLTAGG